METVQDLATRIGLKFSSEDLMTAFKTWNCNCGPAALAAALGCSLDRSLELIPDFRRCKYTSPTMMSEALNKSGHYWKEMTRARKTPRELCPAVLPDAGLVRVQWTGPWTQPGVNPKWAYRLTHWFASFRMSADEWCVFDINSGPVLWDEWRDTIPALITAEIPRADGDWYLTHLWQVGLGT